MTAPAPAPAPAAARPSVVPDLVLALIVCGLALAILVDPPGGLIDGRHLLAGGAVLALLIRTTRAARR